jgi:uncharacterized protein (DUF1800 family)
LAGALVGAVAACAPTTPPAAHYRLVADNTAPLDANPSDIAMLNRVTWGANTSGAQMLATQGLDRYLQSQLHPSADDGLPEDARTEIAALDISQKTLPQINDEIRALRDAAKMAKGTPDYEAAQKSYRQRLVDYARQAATRSLLRDLYSKNQLKEQLTWFWMNHFNVSQNKADIRALVGDYEETAIRPHVLGKFRDLLAATVFHPAMLQYLDNAQNAAGHVNENYAREIMELHTMGVGSGYTQKDVQELARILTGVGVNLSGKPPKVRPDRAHNIAPAICSNSIRTVTTMATSYFSAPLSRGEGLKEVDRGDRHSERRAGHRASHQRRARTVFLLRHAAGIAGRCMAATFRNSDGDIAAVLQTMFAAPEFKASLGRKFKDPIHYAVSALRAAYGDTVILNAQPLLNWLNRMSEPLYGHETPDGYAAHGSGMVRARRDGNAL